MSTIAPTAPAWLLYTPHVLRCLPIELLTRRVLPTRADSAALANPQRAKPSRGAGRPTLDVAAMKRLPAEAALFRATLAFKHDHFDLIR